ncbi:hypothetical protein [Bacillus sp. es.034]|uniref:hypothetical protein n=1 Tax=Bacillus sp. es.034 TaxID=1761763 RepID=UPI000C0080F0|nr:hypothetical protein [Bacillus sp. es.034]PFG04930.1 hypothetical protein ATG71_1726 [Bacillus sp. es.034]
MKEKISDLIAWDECPHVLYAYQDRECYLNNAITYTLDGIDMGGTVLLIENEML